MKALKITGISLLVLLLIITLFISYITMTHGGMQRLFALGSSYVQGELHWSELKGSLVGPADINDLRYTGDDGTSVKIDKIGFDWYPRSLLRRQVDVENFSASGIEIRLPRPVESKEADSKEPFQLKDLRLPVNARIKQIALEDIRVYPYGSDEPIVVDHIHFGGSGHQSELQLVELSARVPQGAVKVDGMINTSGSWPMSLTAAWQYQDEKLGPLQGRATANGNLDVLTIHHELLGAVSSTADLTVSDVTGDLLLSGDLSASTDNLGVFSAAAENMPLIVDAKVNGRLNDLNLDANLASDHEITGPLTMVVSATTNQEVVRLRQVEVRFDESAGVISTTGEVDINTQQVDLQMQWTDLAWPLKQGPVVISDSSGVLSVQASADSVTVTGDAVLEQEQAGRMEVDVDVVADLKQVLVNSITVGGAGTDTSLDVSGLFSIEDNRVDLKGGWENLRWPLTEGAADFQSDSGQFSVIGPLSDYQLGASADVGGAKIPTGKWLITGNGNESALGNLKVIGNTLDGQIQAIGSAGWSPEPEWDFNINARGVNPESQWPGFDASVDIDIKSSGRVTADGLNQSTEILDIGGMYKGQPLGGEGGVSVVDGELVVDNLSLVAGSAKITASGTVGSEVDLQWQVQAPSLEALVPGFKGDVAITGSHSGRADSMGSQIAIESAQIDSDFLKISDLDAMATVDLSGQKKSQVELRANDILLSGQEWDDLLFNASGTPQSHELAMQLNGAQGKLNMQAVGEYADESWIGTITDLSALATAVGDWNLRQPVKVVAGKQEVQFADLCLSNADASVCAALTRKADGTVDADAAIQSFDVATLREILPADIGIDLKIDGEAKVNIDKQGNLKVTANAGFPDGALRYQDRGTIVKRELGQSEITATITNEAVDANANIDLQDLGFITLKSNLSGLGVSANPDAVKPQLRASLDSEIKDLSVVAIFVPELETVTGRLKTNLVFNGAIDSPRITGAANIDDLSLEVPSVALQVTDGALQVSGNGRGGLLLRGAARSGKGVLELDGTYSATTGALDLGVAGQHFRVSNTSRQQVDISPDLNIRFAENKLTVTGELLVPTALIETGGGDSVIVESPDVVIVDSTVVRTEKKENDIDLNVQVTLGDNIRVDAGQFDGALSGGITVNKKPGQVITGSGTIEVVSGDFLVYGQKLTMERGRVLFSGGPIDDPVLDMDVARDVAEYNVKAGVRVTGSAQAPILELQSDPPQTDANTLSFILLGKPVDALGASYTLGRYITPDIYVSFGFDLFDRREIFTLRYQLSDRLSLIGSSSRSREPSSGADLIYTIER